MSEEANPSTDVDDQSDEEQLVSADRYKASVRQHNEASRRAAAAEEKLQALESQLQQEATKDPFDDEEFLSKVRDDPIEGFKTARQLSRQDFQVLRQELAQYLASEKGQLEEKVSFLDPAAAALKEKVEELRQDPEFANFPTSALLKVAGLSSAQAKPRAPSAPSGTQSPTPKEEYQEFDVESDPELAAAYAEMSQSYRQSPVIPETEDK
jgi:hypothetical protein